MLHLNTCSYRQITICLYIGTCVLQFFLFSSQNPWFLIPLDHILQDFSLDLEQFDLRLQASESFNPFTRDPFSSSIQYSSDRFAPLKATSMFFSRCTCIVRKFSIFQMLTIDKVSTFPTRRPRSEKSWRSISLHESHGFDGFRSHIGPFLRHYIR